MGGVETLTIEVVFGIGFLESALKGFEGGVFGELEVAVVAAGG